jgi:type I restriction enzyme S subunit
VIPGKYGLSVGHPGTPTPGGWAWTSLSSVARLETGHTPSRKHPEYWGGEIPWIGIKDVTPNYGRTLTETQEYATQLGIDNSSARVLPAGTVCLSRTASVGYVVAMGVPMATSQDFVNWVCSPLLNACFLKYLLMADRASYLRFASGTTHQTIYMPEVKAFHVLLPPIEVQQKIAAVLAAYDELIENNLRRIEILEEMAQSVYREWFVDFRFPGHEDVPKVDSNVGPIPDGWEASNLGEWVDLAYGKGLKADDRIGGDVPVLGSSGVVGWHNESLVSGPGIVVGRKGNVGSVHWVDTDFYPIDTTFYVISQLPLHFLVHALRLQNFINSDAAVPGLNRSQAYFNPFIVPSVDVLHRFVEVVEPMMDLVKVLQDQIAVLQAARDLLLPKLVSGVLDVSELDIDTERLAS